MSKNKIELGDIFELQTNKRFAYLQYVKKPIDKNDSELIRVFYDLKEKTPENLEDIVNEEEFFFLDFPVKPAIKLNILKKIGNIELKVNFKHPTQFRTENPFGDGWNIIDTNENKYIHTGLIELTEEQKKLSPWGTWNDTLLIENLEEGWRLENWI